MLMAAGIVVVYRKRQMIVPAERGMETRISQQEVEDSEVRYNINLIILEVMYHLIY